MPSGWSEVAASEIAAARGEGTPALVRARLLAAVAPRLRNGDRADVHVWPDGRLTFLVERAGAPASTDQWWDPVPAGARRT